MLNDKNFTIPELVLSNATTFFSGNLEKLFKKAKRLGFKYVEIAPYRWTRPEQILDLQKKYAITVAGIHLPFTSWGQSIWQELKHRKGLWNKFFIIIFRFYLGNVAKNPAIQIAEQLSATKPYFLIHSDVVSEIGPKITELRKRFHVVIENIPGDHTLTSGGVFDHNHFILSRRQYPKLNIMELYKQARPEIIHISYDNPIPASFPNAREQEELKQLLKIHQPRYITIETNPLTNVKKGKLLLEKILHPDNTPI